MIKFEIRQSVSTVKSTWLEVVCSGDSERVMRINYNQVKAEYPDAYFEFVKVETTETCLEFTPKFD